MKKIIPFIIILIASACAQKEKESESWKELDSFHEIMSKAFHPLQDSGNVAPAKMLIDDLAAQASAWSSASLPEKVNTSEMKSMLNNLKTESQALADTIKKGANDDYIKVRMGDLHSQFHEIMEAWGTEHHGEGEHHHDEEDEDEEDDD